MSEDKKSRKKSTLSRVKKNVKKTLQRESVVVPEESCDAGCCGHKKCAVHTPKRVIAYRDERFMFGFVTGLAIAAMAGFILLTNAGIMRSGDVKDMPEGNGVTNAQKARTQVTEDDWVYGNDKAKIAIIEFSDVDCPFCKRFHKTLKDVVSSTDGRVKWVYRHAPLDSLHPNARAKAHAIECIGAQGGNETFWNALDDMMQGIELSSAEEFENYVEKMGVDYDVFSRCMDDGTYATKIQNDLDESQDLGMRGTPFSMIVAGDVMVPISGALSKDGVMNLLAPFLR